MPWSFDFSSSCMMFSSWFNLVLYSFEFLLFLFYLGTCAPNLHGFYRYGPMLALILDTASTAVVCADAYLSILVYQDDALYVHSWTLSANVFLTACSVLLEQSFLIHRFRNLTDSLFITLTLCFLVSIHTAVTLGGTIYVASHTQDAPATSRVASIGNIISYSLRAVTDVAIAGSLVYALARVKAVNPSTKSIMHRVSVNTMSWGLVSALFTLATLILFFVDKSVSSVFFSCLGRVYSLTVLVNMTVHKLSRFKSSRGIHTNGEIELQSAQFNSMNATTRPEQTRRICNDWPVF